MKKTRRTLVTAAILMTAALRYETTELEAKTVENVMSAVYGPPPAYTTTTPTINTLYGPPVAIPDETTQTEPPVTSISNYQTEPLPQPVYGPPSMFVTKGDINMDEEINIADYCRMLSAAIGEEDEYLGRVAADIDENGTINIVDIESMRKYLIGKIPSVDFVEDIVQALYGAPIAQEVEE